MTKTPKTPARDQLTAHRSQLNAHESEAEGINQKLNQFVLAIRAGRTKLARIDALRDDTKGQLGRIALGEVPMTVLADLKKQLATASAEIPAVEQGIELAEAGVELLHQKLKPVGEAIAALRAKTPALEHAARLEIAESYVPGYRAAFEVLADAHAKLLGACLAVDQLAGVGRPPVAANLDYVTLSLPLPCLPSVGAAGAVVPTLSVDVSDKVNKARDQVADELREPA